MQSSTSSEYSLIARYSCNLANAIKKCQTKKIYSRDYKYFLDHSNLSITLSYIINWSTGVIHIVVP